MQEKVKIQYTYVYMFVYNMGTDMQNIKTAQRNSFIPKMPKWLTNINSLFYYYLFLVLLGVVFFCTSLFINYFTTPFTGDYSSQQFAFYTNGYDDWWHFFKTGEFVLYDTNTFLGADNIGSNTFYYLFDPFFMPVLLFPRQLVPQGMAIITIFKMALSGLVFYYYMRYIGASRRASKITGIAYAYSGWISWYLWFNHFTGVAVTFPLILLGIEFVLKEKKPVLLMSSICLLGFVNFFFLVSFVMCGFLYAMFRYFQRLKLNTAKDNLIIILLGFISFLIGILMPMMVVFPSAMHALTSPRASSGGYLNCLKEALKTSNLKKIFELLTSWTAIDNGDANKVKSLFPFIEFIFPVMSCRGTPLTVYLNDTYDNAAGSFYCFLPMLLLLFPAFRSSIKNRHFSVLVPLAFFIFALFTPCFYYLFHGFTLAYSRWTLFVVTSIMAYAGLYLDKIKDDNFVVILEGWSAVVIMILLGAFAAQTITTNYKEKFEERVPIWLAAGIEIVYITALVIVLCIIKYKKKPGFYWVFSGFLVTEISLMGAFVIEGHGVEDYYYTNKGFLKNDALHSLVEKINKEDPSYYRSFSSLTSSVANNDGMRNGFNGLGTFHSIYNFNTADFCNWSTILNGTAPSSWSGTYIQKRINVDTLLGVKYYYIENDYFDYQNRKDATSPDFRYNAPLGYVDISSKYPNKYFKIYKNVDYIDFALTYDSFYEVEGNPVENSSYSGLSTGFRKELLNEELYLQTAIINKYREPEVLEDLKNNHSDISLKEKDKSKLNDYYSVLNIGRYGSIYAGPNAYLTYYDFYSAGEKTLDVDASVYLTLNSSNEKYEKTGSIESNEADLQRYVEVIESKDSCFPNYDPNGNIYYVSASFSKGYGTDIYFVDTNNQIVTYDNHNDGFTEASRSGKEERGFYIAPTYSVDENGSLTRIKEAPKIKKIIIVNREENVSKNHYIAIDTYTNYKAKIDALKQYAVTDVVSGTNKYKFKTNFDKERIVVTRLAYEEGFKLSMTNALGNKKDINVFNGQGGFVSFISGTGDCSYELTFETPNLKIASLISSLSVFAYFSTIVSYIFIDLKRKEKELTNLL